MKRKGAGLWNFLLVIICAALFAVLAFFLIQNKASVSAEKQRLENIAQGTENPSEKKKPQEEPEKEEPQEEKTEDEKSEETTEQDAQPEAEKDVQVKGISCWGDEFLTGEDVATKSYPAVLQNLLNENGYDIAVENKMLAGGSTLSLMKMAGVQDDVLQNYITSHQAAANGGDISIFETGIRDLTEEQLTRNDKDYIPVIFMGYYGGWNHDPKELIEQQQRILDTFGANKDKFIVIGMAPEDGSVDQASYDAAMQEKWGEHYIGASSAAGGNAIASYEGQNSIAQTIYQTIEEKGYISK